jgi:hypothetical protein
MIQQGDKHSDIDGGKAGEELLMVIRILLKCLRRATCCVDGYNIIKRWLLIVFKLSVAS